MGASGWRYFTPYQENLETVLQQLRQKVFESGQYGHISPISSEMLSTYPQLRKITEQLKELDKQRLAEFGPIETIDDLLEAFGEDGTHTIIDIERISPKPDFGVAYPAPNDIIEKIYGAPKPTHHDIESKFGVLLEALNIERWQAAYVIVYDQGVPKEIYFEGCSGD
jgi:hypothetical protein